MIFCVGSTNKVKVHAVRLATQSRWPDAEVQGFKVASDVSEQPFSDDETRTGAENRARAALAAGIKAQAPAGSELTDMLGIGLEGGVFEHANGELWSTVWVVVVDSQGRVYEANGGRIKVHPLITARLRQGQELGPLMEQLTGTSDVRSNQGMFGVVTNNFVDRTQEYSSIARMAIGIWYGRHWADTLQSQVTTD